MPGLSIFTNIVLLINDGINGYRYGIDRIYEKNQLNNSVRLTEEKSLSTHRFMCKVTSLFNNKKADKNIDRTSVSENSN